MAIRAIVTGTITFGLVAIPVKVYTAASSNAVSFNMLSPAGNRVKQRLVDAVTGEEVLRDQTQKGYEFAKDNFVVISREDLKALEVESSKTMEIQEFVTEGSLSSLRVEKTYFLGPNKGGDKGYALLSKVMKDTGKVAIAQWGNRGKEHLVAIRAHEGGLILQQLYYDTELRNFDEVEIANMAVSDAEAEMALMLVEKMSSGAFESEKYQDRFAQRVEALIESKVNNKEPAVYAAAPNTKVLDLLAALKNSLVEGGDPAPEPAPVKRKKAKKK